MSDRPAAAPEGGSYSTLGSFESAEARGLAPRPATLDGLRLGILDNTKWNASKLLRQVVTQLEGGLAFGAVRTYAKSSFSRLAPPDLLDRIASETDAVVTAIGD